MEAILGSRYYEGFCRCKIGILSSSSGRGSNKKVIDASVTSYRCSPPQEKFMCGQQKSYEKKTQKRKKKTQKKYTKKLVIARKLHLGHERAFPVPQRNITKLNCGGNHLKMPLLAVL